MSKRDVVFLPGQYYHIYNRGANRELIFREPQNYLFLLKKIKQYAVQYQIAIIAYCLMPNHYHFLLRQDGETLVSVFMQAVFNSYTKAFNKKYARTGTLFEERFRAIAVAQYDYLLHLCRYIHSNPVNGGLTKDPGEWPFSNYLEWVGRRSGTLFDSVFVAENFPNPAEYEMFVTNHVPPATLAEEIKKFLLD